uniref:Putative LOC100197221 [Hydra vulgaris] n=1 Tax=Lepeophtheirus salmonis TaxID=72036 RepID=A0A0K2VB71_LEPSM
MHVEWKVCSVCHPNTDALKAIVWQYRDAITKDYIHSGYLSLPPRRHDCHLGRLN